MLLAEKGGLVVYPPVTPWLSGCTFEDAPTLGEFVIYGDRLPIVGNVARSAVIIHRSPLLPF